MWTWGRLTRPSPPKLNPPTMLPLGAFNATGDVVVPRLIDGTRQSHHSSSTIKTHPSSLNSHKRHSIGKMSTNGFYMLSVVALRCIEALHFPVRNCCYAFQCCSPLLHAPLIFSIVALRSSVDLHCPGPSSQSPAQASLHPALLFATLQPCLEDREALPARDAVVMHGQKPKYLSQLKPIAMALTWKFRRKCSELFRIGRMNCPGHSVQL